MPEFIPGLILCEAFYREAVRPILDEHFPRLPHSAALIGFGSDVLGFDTPTSRDHMWGPRLLLFLPEDQIGELRAPILDALRQNLPVQFRGYSTHFGNPDGIGVRLPLPVERGPVDPLIQFHTLSSFWQQELGASPYEEPGVVDWLTFQQHPLLSLTAGKVFHDDLGLERARARFAFYPREVWLYLIAAQWQLISQEEAFPGRAASMGDWLGARVVAARQAERLMRLCFLFEKHYPPYSKWFGTAFQRLESGPEMGTLLEQALPSSDYGGMESALAQAYTFAAILHNHLGITPPLDPRTRAFSEWHLLNGGQEPRSEQITRPFQVLFAGRFSQATYAAIMDPEVRRLIPFAGSVNQFMVESSDMLQNVQFCRRLRSILSGSLLEEEGNS